MGKGDEPFEYRKEIESIFDEFSQSVKLSRNTAWQFLYRSLLWFEKIGSKSVPHLRETNDLKKRVWLGRAQLFAQYLEENLEPVGTPLPDRVDLLYKRRVGIRKKLQRQNITGTGFEIALSILLERVCCVTPLIKPNLKDMQGFELAPAMFVQQPDLTLFDKKNFKVLISSKWSLRKDRLGEHLYEAAFYRKRRPDLYIVFVVNEFDPSRLLHLVRAPEVDQVYHVRLESLLSVFNPFPENGAISQEALKTNKQLAKAFEDYQDLQKNIRDLKDLFDDIDRVKL
jgi:hypothetical protein